MTTCKVLFVLSLISLALINISVASPEVDETSAFASHPITQADMTKMADALDELFEQDPAFGEVADVVDESTRQKRACRRVRTRSHTGRIIIIIKC